MVRMRSYIPALCIALVLTGVVSGSDSNLSQSSVTLERGMCFGTCPVYNVTLFGNGSVMYGGQMYVKEVGIRNGTVNATAYARLMELFDQSGFFGMNDNYTAYYITDMPSARITITNGTGSKRVDHYFGDRSAPKVLFTLEDVIDQVANVTQWTTPWKPDNPNGEQI